MGDLLPIPGNSGIGPGFFVLFWVECFAFGSTLVRPFGFDFPAAVALPLPSAARFALDLGEGAIAKDDGHDRNDAHERSDLGESEG